MGETMKFLVFTGKSSETPGFLGGHGFCPSTPGSGLWLETTTWLEPRAPKKRIQGSKRLECLPSGKAACGYAGHSHTGEVNLKALPSDRPRKVTNFLWAKWKLPLDTEKLHS